MRKIIDYAMKRIELLVGVLFITLFLLNILKISLRYFWGISWLWVPVRFYMHEESI